MKISEQQILKMMKCLDLTREEAIELIKDDMEVDKMSTSECTSDMTDEQKKAAKSVTATTGEKKKKTATTPVKRDRKKDDIKVEIISTVAHNLTRCCFGDGIDTVHDVVILKPEKEITFTVNGEEYSITLTKHRKKD